MLKLKNRIITISGEPASGKSTVIKKLKKDYEEKGYLVHISTIGNEFRKIAQQKGLTIHEFNKYMESRTGIDEYIDSQVAKQGKEINKEKRENEVFIFDSRLAWHNIPESMSIRLTTDNNVAGKRVFQDKSRGEEDKYNTLEEAISDTEKRKISEIQRYKDRYGIDLQNPENYNLIIDTSFSKVEDIASTIEQCLELEMQNKYYAKKWTSPKKLLPMQREMDTIRKGGEYTLDEMKEIIDMQGFKPSEEIDVLNVDGILSIVEGHHRNFAAGSLGKTLVPYYELAKDDELVPGTQNTARQRAKLSKSNLYGHEWLLEKENETFSYNDVYPGIYKQIEKEENKTGEDR